MFKGQFRWQPIQNARGDADEFGESSVLAVVFTGDAEDAASLAEVDLTFAAKIALATIDGGIESNTVAFFPGASAFAELGDYAGSFVPHDDRRAAAADHH